MANAYLQDAQIEEIEDSYNRRHHVLLKEVVAYTSTQLHTYKHKEEDPIAKSTLCCARRMRKHTKSAKIHNY